MEGRWIDGVWIEPPMDDPAPIEQQPTATERMEQIEAALIELAGIVAGGA